jgi:pyruvate/2-oxoglutarate dehydrogenase complex dihydrolipoamide dehydrogenase (E3) component
LITSKDTLDKTNIDNIYALGDVVDGVPELTGTVQKAAVLLAKRLAADMGKIKIGKKEYKALTMDYKDYPTTIFTPLEYSVCGLSEEQAIKQLGEDNF